MVGVSSACDQRHNVLIPIYGKEIEHAYRFGNCSFYFLFSRDTDVVCVCDENVLTLVSDKENAKLKQIFNCFHPIKQQHTMYSGTWVSRVRLVDFFSKDFRKSPLR